MSIFSEGAFAQDSKGKVGPFPPALAKHGPRLDCQVRLDAESAVRLQKANKKIPPGVVGKMLVDTGASMTCVEESVLTSLKLKPVSVTTVQGPTGQEPQFVYPCGLAFPGSSVPTIKTVFVLGSKLKKQGLIGLMGRDILQHGLLIFNGTSGHWSLAF